MRRATGCRTPGRCGCWGWAWWAGWRPISTAVGARARLERAPERRCRSLCYTAIMRPGKTKTTSFSLAPETLRDLKALARRRHAGNVSALLAEIAAREVKFAAAERFFEKYGVAPLD